jgi:hypothetical protein
MSNKRQRRRWLPTSDASGLLERDTETRERGDDLSQGAFSRQGDRASCGLIDDLAQGGGGSGGGRSGGGSHVAAS